MLDIEFEIRITFETVEEEVAFEEEVDKNDSVGCDEDVEVSEDSAKGRVDEGVDVADEVDADEVDADVVDDNLDDADLRFV